MSGRCCLKVKTDPLFHWLMRHIFKLDKRLMWKSMLLENEMSSYIQFHLPTRMSERCTDGTIDSGSFYLTLQFIKSEKYKRKVASLLFYREICHLSWGLW